MRCAPAPKGHGARGPLAALSEESPAPLLHRDHLPAPILHVSHGKGPFPTSVTRVLGSGRGTRGRGCYAACPVSDGTVAALTTACLRYGASLAWLTATCSGLLVTTFSAAGPSSPRAGGPLSVGPQNLGALAALPVHTPPPAGALTPLPCAPHPAVASPPCGLRAPLLSCGPQDMSRQVPAAEGENRESKPQCPALPRCRGKRVATCCPCSPGRGRAFPVMCVHTLNTCMCTHVCGHVCS